MDWKPAAVLRPPVVLEAKERYPAATLPKPVVRDLSDDPPMAVFLWASGWMAAPLSCPQNAFPLLKSMRPAGWLFTLILSDEVSVVPRKLFNPVPPLPVSD